MAAAHRSDHDAAAGSARAAPDPAGQITAWLEAFSAYLARGDISSALSLFADASYWRDMVAFTWNITTLDGQAQIRAMLEARLGETAPSDWRIDGQPRIQDGVVEAFFTFSTALGRGRGVVRLREGRCWTLLTTLNELRGFEERKGRRRERGTEHGARPGRRSWLDRRTDHRQRFGIEDQPYCLVIGGGQGGLALAARLRRLDVPTLVIDKNPRPGDGWRNRYHQLCLHDPVWYDHLPYLPFPDDWPIFSPKDKLGDWLEMYAHVMEIDFWGSTTCLTARPDGAGGSWSVEVEREGERLTLRPTHVVFALGVSGYPSMPSLPGAEHFAGEQMHSSAYHHGARYASKRCVVLGANNSAHDICADLWECGADVTMVQRSSTLVIRSDTFIDRVLAPLYSEQAIESGIDVDRADLLNESYPAALLAQRARPLYQDIARQDAEFYARLTAAGFRLDFGEDGSGLHLKYLRRGSGYYIDVGASELIADGRVKLASGVGIASLQENAVVLTDGRVLPADLVVYATGFGSMSQWVADLVSPEVARRVGRCWGIGSDTQRDPGPWEGELRNMWKPTAQPGLWFQGGNLRQARFFSQLLALQLKARMEGLPTPVHGQAAVHHGEWDDDR